MNEMQKNRILIVLAPLFCLMMTSSLAHAAEITTCTFDKTSYYPGQTGYVTVTVFNDKDSTIRIYELTATIDYYYNDDNIYVQSFFTNPNPPTEIQHGQSSTFDIDFSLPTNIAPGYTTLLVRARTEIWNDGAQRWQGSDQPTYQPTLYIESPYKQQNTAIMYVLGAITIIFAVVIGVLLIILRSARAKFLAQSTA